MLKQESFNASRSHLFNTNKRCHTNIHDKEQKKKKNKNNKLQIFSQVYIKSYFSLSFIFHATKKKGSRSKYAWNTRQ